MAALVGRIIVGLGLAIPIVVVFGALLASADLVFASFMSFDAGFLWTWTTHAILTIVAGALIVGFSRKSSRSAPVDNNPPTFSIGKVEAIVVLGSIDALFAVFALSQIYAVLGAGDELIADAGLTYSDYARQGFFQLLWVAGLALLVLATIWTLRQGAHKQEALRYATRVASESDESGGAGYESDEPQGHYDNRWVSGLTYISGLLTLGIVAVALVRLMLYIDDKGLTPLRFYSSVFSIWIGVAFVILMIRVSGFGSERAWLSPALISSGMLVLFGLNLVNPESIIATQNLELQSVAADGQTYPDTAVLGEDKLSGDGLQILIEGSDSLPPELADRLHDAICGRYFDPDADRGWTGYNFSEASAQQAKKEYCA